ncbi:LytTR family two component transcriptional regulator [Lacrimispora xylanisolvens]|uniref:Stage 0 sporulation protein A homolog n=1 Tax=Lacrimispora xylanisolvens TaxID=384636 RepID=A0A2S6HNH6_9FIRM|nr:LytTR family DNA-binding domain-containing protein [Hungatella xylanolytica]PPK79044.1 LytTR family two component transcriptional regulator [Hungatella xylanolytica]
MYTIFLCDDIQETLDEYASLIKTIAEKNQIQVTISSFSSGEQLLFHLSDSPGQADIIYMDILMHQLNGIETARRLRDSGCQSEIIFLTTSDEYVFEAFDVTPVQYLLKGETTPERFERVFLQAISRIQKKGSDIFLCESQGVQKVLSVSSISFFEITKRIVTVQYNGSEEFSFYSSMENIENQLSGKGFVRVHRSYIVNLSYIVMFQQNAVCLKTGTVIPLGVTYIKQVRKAFSDYISRISLHVPK